MIVVPLLVGFALGSIPFAWIVVRLVRGVDIRREGSGNVGALNSLRVSRSKKVGVSVLLLDLAKGAAAGALGLALGRVLDLGPDVGWGAAMFGAMAGHVYNPWFRGKGGKGFAALAGAAFVNAPWIVLCWFATFWALWAVLRLAKGIDDEAPSSLLATLLAPAYAYALYGPTVSLAFAACTLLVLPRLWPEVMSVVRSAGVAADLEGDG